MENYQLKATEVVLFRSIVTLSQNANQKNIETELLLTNENFVFVNKQKKLFLKDQVETVVVPMESIKIYNEMPYMLLKKDTIEIYTLVGEYFVIFENKKQAKEFFDKSMRVASGCSKFVRSVKKVSKEIKDANDALGIDLATTTKKTLDFAADVAITYSDLPKRGKVQLLGAVARVFKSHSAQDKAQIEQSAKTEQAQLPCPEKTEEDKK